MILKGLFKKLKFVILLIVIIVVVAIVVKILKLKPAIEKMIKDELGLARLSHSMSSTSNSEDNSKDSTSWEERIGSFLFPSQAKKEVKRREKDVKQKRTKVRTAAPQDGLEEDEEPEKDEESEESGSKKRGRDPVRRKNSKTSNYKREELCRAFFENYFDDYFPTCRPKFLTNPKTGKPLELDGYNARLNLSFEHNGQQHRVYTPRFHASPEDFAKQQERDVFKRKRLEELGIDLIEISDQVPTSQLESFLLRAVRELGH